MPTAEDAAPALDDFAEVRPELEEFRSRDSAMT
jgi:hypothetical protein